MWMELQSKSVFFWLFLLSNVRNTLCDYIVYRRIIEVNDYV